MGLHDKYKCVGQMELFDFIEKDSRRFCWDNDINEIIGKLKELADTHGLEIGKVEFRVWEHVPHLGYRLWLDVEGTRTELFANDFRNDVGELVEHAKGRNVELTPVWGACMFFKNDRNEKGRLSFTTVFMDKQRQRRR